MWVKFNGIKLDLVPRFAIILLYSEKVSVLIIFHAKFQGQTRKASLWENRMFYDMRSAQIRQDF